MGCCRLFPVGHAHPTNPHSPISPFFTSLDLIPLLQQALLGTECGQRIISDTSCITLGDSKPQDTFCAVDLQVILVREETVKQIIEIPGIRSDWESKVEVSDLGSVLITTTAPIPAHQVSLTWESQASFSATASAACASMAAMCRSMASLKANSFLSEETPARADGINLANWLESIRCFNHLSSNIRSTRVHKGYQTRP